MNSRLRRIIPFALVLALIAGQVPSSVAPVVAQETGTIRITLLGCPDGPITTATINTTACTNTLDAPDEAVAFWQEGEGGTRLVLATDVERDVDGAYVIGNVPAGAEVQLSFFQPTAHNYYMFFGTDENLIDGPWDGRLTMEAGGTREVSVLYWNGEFGFRESDQSTVDLTFQGCPEGVDPRTAADPVAACTEPMDAPENAWLVWDMEGGAKVSSSQRMENGTYRIEGIPSFITVGLRDFASDIRDEFVATPIERMTPEGIPQIDLYRGDTRHVHIFYHDGGELVPAPTVPAATPPTGATTETGEPGVGSASLDITLRGCPEGVDPTAIGDAVTVCTIPLDAPDAAKVIWGGDGQGGMDVILAPRIEDGTYQIATVPANQTITFTGFEPSVRDAYTITGTDGVTPEGLYFVELVPGEVAHIYVFYYFFP